MTISLYDAIVPSFQQLLGTMTHLIGKAEAHCAEHDLDHAELIEARLYEDMAPFNYQLKSTAEHSVGAIEATKKGVFTPSLAPSPDSFAGLRERIDGAQAALAALNPDEINALEKQNMRFEFRDLTIPFTGADFLLSFAQPNFYFHATTAYGVLRSKGVKLGKMDFMGRVRAKG